MDARPDTQDWQHDGQKMRRGTTAFPLTPAHTSARLKGTTGGPDTAQKRMNDMEKVVTNEELLNEARAWPYTGSRVTTLIRDLARALAALLAGRIECARCGQEMIKQELANNAANDGMEICPRCTEIVLRNTPGIPERAEETLEERLRSVARRMGEDPDMAVQQFLVVHPEAVITSAEPARVEL